MAKEGGGERAQGEVKTYVDERDIQARSRQQCDGGGHFAIDILSAPLLPEQATLWLAQYG